MQLSFADPIREMVRASGMFKTMFAPFGINKQTLHPRWEVSPRHVMQTLGTEWGRELIHETLWRDLTMDKCLDPLMLYIITDVRFLNEAEEIQERGGVIWRIRTPDDNADWLKTLWRLASQPPWRRHRSELELMSIDPDWVIENDHKGLPSYARSVSEMLRAHNFLAEQQILPELPTDEH